MRLLSSIFCSTLLLTTTPLVYADLERAHQALATGDQQVAVMELTRLAGEGEAEAQFELGQIYANGQLTERDPGRALLALTLAQENGHPQALALIEPLKQEINLYQLAALQEELGTLFQKGGPVRPDPGRAALWLGERALNPAPFEDEERGELARKVGRLYEEKILSFTSAHSWYILAEAFGSGRGAKDRLRMELFLQESSLIQSRNEAIDRYKRYLKQKNLGVIRAAQPPLPAGVDH